MLSKELLLDNVGVISMSVYEVTCMEQMIRGHSVRMIPRIEKVRRTFEIVSTDKNLRSDLAPLLSDSRYEVVSVRKLS